MNSIFGDPDDEDTNDYTFRNKKIPRTFVVFDIGNNMKGEAPQFRIVKAKWVDNKLVPDDEQRESLELEKLSTKLNGPYWQERPGKKRKRSGRYNKGSFRRTKGRKRRRKRGRKRMTKRMRKCRSRCKTKHKSRARRRRCRTRCKR